MQSTVLEFNDTHQREKPLSEFLLPNSVCDITANSKSSDTVWFVLILEQKVAKSNEADDYGYIIPKECSFIKGHYLEKSVTVCKEQKFKIMADKKAYTYRENIVHQFVNVEKKNDLFDLCNVINCLEHYGMANI